MFKDFIIEIFLFCCFSLILSNTYYIIIDSQIDKISAEYTSSNTFVIYTNAQNLKNYDFDYLTIKIENKNSMGQISFLSTLDSSCKNDRKQMSLNAYGNSSFIIKNSEIKSISQFYICVFCLYNYNCVYKIKVDQNYRQRLPYNEYSYTYYSSENYKTIDLGVRAENNIIDQIKKNDKKYYEIFWVKRNFKNSFITDFGSNEFPKILNIASDYNAVYLIDNFDKENKIIDFNITSNEENLISVGSKFITGGENYITLYVNDIETIGHLQKNFDTECFELKINQNEDNLYIYGYIYDKFGKTYFKNGNKIISQKEIIEGNIFEVINKSYNNLKFCVTFLNSDNYETLNQITFSIQMVSNKFKYYNYYYTFKQIPEAPFPRYLAKGEYMILSEIRESKKSSSKISITINSIYGNPKISMYQCVNFPLYTFNENDFKEIVYPNIMKQYQFNQINPFYPNATLLAINCPDKTESCIFDTTFISENDYILLNERKMFSQILLKSGEKNFFRIDFQNHRNVQKIFIEFINLNSDIQINFDNNLEIVNYFLINKNIYLINVNNSQNQYLNFSIVAKKKGFYSIRYNLIRNEEDFTKFDLLDTIGFNYIDYINNTYKYKTIEIQNFKYGQTFPVLFNIYSPDCRLKITNNSKEINTFLYNNLYQEYIPNDNQKYYNLNISVLESQGKRCLLYLNNIKLSKENSAEIGNLIINENVPQTIIFKKINKMRFVFSNIDNNFQTLINLKLLNKATYTLNIKNYNNQYTQQITSNQFIFINTKDLQFDVNEENKLIFEISLISSFTENPMIETTVRQIKKKYFYLEKGLFKNNTIQANKELYLYTDIYSEEEGYAKYDFIKGKNEINGKIVKINEININEDVNWESLKKGNEIIYDLYTKKMIFTKKDTLKCEEGCYLLIYIKTPDFTYYNFEINIMVSLTKRDISLMPKIKFNEDQYITGTLVNNNYDSEIMYELYELYIPFDAKSITIECISELAELLVYMGNPNNYNAKNFEVKPNQILTIKNSKETKEGMNIIIYVYAKKIDLIDITYSFKVHLNKENEFEINKVKNNQKTLCNPQLIDNSYICLFIISPSSLYSFNYLLLYSKSYSENSKVDIYGKFFAENNDISLILNEDESSCYSNKNTDNNFLLVPPNESNNYFYVKVISNYSNTIELISNFYNYDVIPTPNLMQIYILNRTLKNEITLNFLSINPIYINIVSLKGEGKIKFKDKAYDLKENDSRRAFALNTNSDKYIIKINNAGNENENFIFYIQYNLRNSTINFDEVKFGKNYEIEYEIADYPLYIYSEFDKEVNHDINIFFNFYNLTLNNKSEIQKYVKNKELNVFSWITINEDKYKLNEMENNLLKIKGVYDPAIRAGQILIPGEYIDQSISQNISTFFLKIEKDGDNNNLIYEGMNMKTTFIKENSLDLIEENKYYLGKVNNNITNIYKLIANNLSDNIIIQFASNSKLVNFTLTDEKNIKNYENNSFEILEYKEDMGKIIIKFKNPKNIDYIYLKVFINNNLTINSTINSTENLSNYIFKYKNSFTSQKDNEYKIKNNNRKLKLGKKDEKIETNIININYNEIKNQAKYEVIYSLKIIKSKDLIKGELIDTIAITESNWTIIQFTKMKIQDNINQISIPDYYFVGDLSYIILIAQVIDGDNIEYITYEPLSTIELFDESDEDDSSKLLYISICSGIILILIISGIIFLKCKKKDVKSNDDEIMKHVEMANPIEYDDVLLDQS